MDERRTAELDRILGDGPVIPVVTIKDARTAVPLARALVAGGVRVIEVTLRTAAGLEAIARIAAEVPDAIVGAGTVLTGEQAEQSVAAGARFLVSPGLAPRLSSVVAGLPVPMLPGVATPSEAMAALEAGLTRLKFFPAEPAGGVPMLNALLGPLAELQFCPTGGIDLPSAPRYLACSNVRCIGGSWLTPAKALAEGAWDFVEAEARRAVALLGADARRGSGA